MTEQWKPIGDKWPQPAMVMVNGHRSGGHRSILVGDQGASDWIILAALHPMPPTITPEQQAVLDAADAQEKTYTKLDWQPPAEVKRTHETVRALRAAQQPPDPVKELRAAWNALCSIHPKDTVRMEAAIAALEKEKKS